MDDPYNLLQLTVPLLLAQLHTKGLPTHSNTPELCDTLLHYLEDHAEELHYLEDHVEEWNDRDIE